MTTQATSGYGCLLKRGDGGGPENFTTVAEVIQLDGPSFKLDLAEITSMSSAGRFKEYVPTLLDGGEIQLEAAFLPADATQSYAAGVLSDMVNRVLRNFRIVWSNSGGTTWTLPCYVTAFQPAGPVGDALKVKITLKVSGQPTLA